MSPEDAQVTFCATLVDQWVALGLRHAVVAPGSRSTPMALALAARPDLEVHVAHDERTAAFMALGVGMSTGVPAALLCTSGTAATHFHAAVVEADLSGVPMLVLTADRPPELQGIGAPQTIDQLELYGSTVRLFVQAEVPDEQQAHTWRDLADDTWLASVGSEAGPVHLNLPFREPLVGTVQALPAASAAVSEPDDEPVFLSRLSVDDLVGVLSGQRGVVVAGRGVRRPALVEALASRLGWPVLADPRSGCRAIDGAVCAFDPILRHGPFAVSHRPSVVLHLGEPPASKVLGQWLQASGATQVLVHPQPRTIDPLRMIDERIYGEVEVVLETLIGRLGDGGPADAAWADAWRGAEARAQRAIGAVLTGPDLDEPTVARVLSTVEGPLVLSSSMPVRDVEWFGAPSTTVVHSNRGANGIDGVIATAVGVAVGSGRPTTVLVGDVAFCHDQSSLTALAARMLPLTVVVTDNDGGGIFSFLPQRSTLPVDRFEQLFGTPHGTDICAVARAHGLGARTVDTVSELRDALSDREATVVRVAGDRDRNVVDHDRVYAAVAAALDAGRP